MVAFCHVIIWKLIIDFSVLIGVCVVVCMFNKHSDGPHYKTGNLKSGMHTVSFLVKFSCHSVLISYQIKTLLDQ